MGDYIAKWHRELGIFCRIKPLIIVEGNVLDVYQYPVDGSTPKGSILRLPEYLHYYFTDLGYKTIAFFDSMQGFYNSCEEGHIQSFAELTHAKLEGDYIRSDFKGKANSATSLVRTAVNQNKQPVAIVMNLASRYITSPDNIDQSEVDSFTNLLLASMEGKDVRTPDGTLKNLVVMIVNKVNDVPAWFYLDNPNVKTVSIGTPSKEEREQLIKGENFASFFAADIYDEDYPYFEDHPDELEKVQDRFVGLTEGFSFTEINGLRRLCKNERTRIRQMSSVIDLYRYGIKENPWDSLDVNELKTAKEDFQKRVKGQDFAIIKTLDVVKRAVTGMAGLQSSSHAKPKGILFFAGPTGTGKTETAKTLAEKLFGDESCCIRFDMSEYSQSHSDQKLLGAPPGYVRQGKYLKQITSDHTTYNWLLSSGQLDSAERCNKSEITNCFGGNNPALLSKLYITECQRFSLALLTSDGVHEYVDLDSLEEIVSGEGSLGDKCEEIIQKAIKSGSEDDLTVVIICPSEE